MADYGLTEFFSELLEDGDLICHYCLNSMQFEEIDWYQPVLHADGAILPDGYRELLKAAYVCPQCDTPLDEENLKEYQAWRNKQEEKQ